MAASAPATTTSAAHAMPSMTAPGTDMTESLSIWRIGSIPPPARWVASPASTATVPARSLAK